MAPVSVVIPTHDRRGMLLEALGSVLAQTFGDLEVVVVDDGSTDGTRTAVAACNDPRVRLVALARCGVVGAVRNAGCDAASGRWIAFLDSDDLWDRDKLQVQLDSITTAGAAWGFTGYDVVRTDGCATIARIRPRGSASPSELLLRLVTAAESAALSTLLVQRALLRRIGGFTTEPLVREDTDLVLRLAEVAPATAVSARLAVIRDHEGRTTAADRDPFLRSALTYRRFMLGTADRRAAAAARAPWSEQLLSSARLAAGRGAWMDGVRRFASSARGGVSRWAWWRRVLSSASRRLLPPRGATCAGL